MNYDMTVDLSRRWESLPSSQCMLFRSDSKVLIMNWISYREFSSSFRFWCISLPTDLLATSTNRSDWHIRGRQQVTCMSMNQIQLVKAMYLRHLFQWIQRFLLWHELRNRNPGWLYQVVFQERAQLLQAHNYLSQPSIGLHFKGIWFSKGSGFRFYTLLIRTRLRWRLVTL